MTLRHLCAGLILVAAISSTGCSCGRIFRRDSACCPPAAVPAAPCCGEPAPVVPVVPAGPAPAVQSFSVQPPCCNGV
jgi:hypothetical protein